MQVKQRMPLAEAEALANDLAELLRHGCRRIVIAGSIRRRRAYVGDIDLVCEPAIDITRDLFGDETGKLDRLDALCNWLESEGVLAKRLDVNGRACWGLGLKRAMFKGVPVDMQAVTDPDVWGSWLLIRTGPAEFNKRLVTQQAQGGLLPNDMRFRDGFRLHGGLRRIPTPTEESVFEALGMTYVRPEERA